MIQINFLEDKIIEENKSNDSLLAISLKNLIPHINACSGQGRCSTCRVLILDGFENVLPRNELETSLAKKKGLEENIRIACQTRINGNVKLKRLVIDNEDIEIAVKQNGSSGREEKIAILFSDIRGFTTFSEKTLPYDVIHILNRYFNKMGAAVLSNHGFIDKYIGDGLMALFGIGNPNSEEACLQATTAALKMIEELEELNKYLEKNFSIRFEIGIGIHFGTVILGEVGHPDKKTFTAIGDNVNLASRVESSCKKAKTNFLVSEVFYNLIKHKVLKGNTFETSIKGKSGKFHLFEIKGILQKNISEIEKLDEYLNDKISVPMAPAFIRLAFHDAGNFDSITKTGGLNSSIRFELHRPENNGLQKFVELIYSFQKEMKSEGYEFSFSDLIAYSTKIALLKLGGPALEISLGRVDSNSEGESLKTPHTNFSFQELLLAFESLSLNLEDLVALSGAHTIGFQNKKAFTDTPYQFNNSYYKDLVNSNHENLIPTDLVLLQNANAKEWVLKFSQDEILFRDSFKKSMEKLLHLGNLIK